jgi:hypothetical protein
MLCAGMPTPETARTLIFRSKPLILKKKFLLISSSFCHGQALARVGGAGRVISQQSYPQDS